MSDDVTTRALHQVLARSSLGAAVHQSNLVNIETPGYRAKAVEFREELARADTGTADPLSGARVVEAEPIRVKEDGNTVDLDHEFTEFMKDMGRYRSASRMLRKHFALLRYAVTDGKG